MKRFFNNGFCHIAAWIAAGILALAIGTAVCASEPKTETAAEAKTGESVVLRVAFPETEGFTMKDEEGNRHGMVVDYLNEIAKYTGWEYEYIDADSNTMMNEFLEGKYDLMGGMYYIPGLEESFAYPDYSCGNSKSVLLARWDDTSIRGYDYADLNGKTIGVYARAAENIRRLNEFLSMNGITCTIRGFTNEEIIDNSLDSYLERGEVDLLLGNAADDNGKFRSVARFDAQPHYIVTLPGNQEILDGLNLALQSILECNPNYAQECYEANFPDAGRKNVVLNEKERAYIQKKGTVTVAVPKCVHPFHCVNIEDGDHRGIIPDFLEKITEFSGLAFTCVFTDNYAEALALAQSGGADMLGFFIGDERQAADAGLALSQSFVTLNNLIVRNKTVTYPSDGLICGLLDGRTLPANIQAEKIVRFSEVGEALDAVNRKEIDFVYGLSPQIESEMQRNIYSNIVPVSLYEGSNDICFAIPKPIEVSLLTIVNKAINSISEQERVMMSNANMISLGKVDFSLETLIYGNPMLVISCIILFLLLLVVIIVIVLRFKVKAIKVQGELEKVEENSRAKSQFLSQMTHEIRTPMNGIVGMVELCREYADDPARVRSYLDKVDLSSQHLLALINDILDMSKIESGRIELDEEAFDLGILMRELKSVFYVQAREKGISYEMYLCGQLEDELVGDSLRLNQILTNLLANAMKFTSVGGKVILTAKELQREDEKLWIDFEITDTGCGIAEENMERIFAPFEQEYAGTTRKYGGTGLGLPITRNFVEMMGGRISVKSEVNVGSSFRVVLPFGYNRKNAQRQGCGIGKRVLLLNRRPDPRVHFMEFLHREGFDVDLVAEPSQAERRISDACREGRLYQLCMIRADLIADIKDTVERVRKAAGKEEMKVILIGYDQEELEEKVLETHSDGLLCQPIFSSDIAALLRKYEEVPDKAPRQTLEGCFAGLKVLVAEDNLINREVSVGLLEVSGACTDTACDGREAVEIFNASPVGYYDMILMDMQMPVMDGCSATRAIRELPREDAASVYIFAMTANAMSEDVCACLESGMDSHIGKPFNLADIYNCYKAFADKEDS